VLDLDESKWWPWQRLSRFVKVIDFTGCYFFGFWHRRHFSRAILDSGQQFFDSKPLRNCIVFSFLTTDEIPTNDRKIIFHIRPTHRIAILCVGVGEWGRREWVSEVEESGWVRSKRVGEWGRSEWFWHTNIFGSGLEILVDAMDEARFQSGSWWYAFSLFLKKILLSKPV